MDVTPEQPVPEQPVSVPPPSHPRMPKKILFVVIILGLIIAVGYFFHSAIFGLLKVPTETRFSVVEGGALRWYSVQGSKVTKAHGPLGFDKSSPSIQEAAPQLKSSDIPVLAQKSSESSGSLLGVLRGHTMTFVPFLQNDTAPKLGLSDRPDSRVSFAEYKESTTTNGIAGGNWMLFAYSLYQDPSGKPIMLGTGYDPRFAANGSLIAIAPEGLVRIDSVGGGRSILIDRPGIPLDVSAVAPDASMVILPNKTTKALYLFSIRVPEANSVSYVGSLNVPAVGVSFLSPKTFVVDVDHHTFNFYSVEAGKVATTSSAKL